MKVKDFSKSIYLLKGLFIAFIVTTVLIVFFSVLLTYSTMRESKIPLLNTIIMIISIASGSIYMGKKVKENGWINGGLIGISYYIILIMLNYLLFKSFTIDIFSITRLFLASITGVIGGIIGINI